MAFRLSGGDLASYMEIMERVTTGRLLEFLEMVNLERVVAPRRGKRGYRARGKRK